MEFTPAARARFGAAFASRTFGLAVAGSVLLWLAFPPVGWSWLAWFAPACWVRIASGESRDEAGSRPYLGLWLAGTVHWLLVMQGLRHPHPALYLGWFALAAYVGIYLPCFVVATRTAVRRFRVPIVLAAPVAWTGLEFVRGRLLTGFSLALLGHTQVHQTTLIQVADLGGAYAVSFVVMLVAACGEQAIARRGRSGALHAAVAAAALAGVLTYGAVRQQHFAPNESTPAASPATTIALLQSQQDTVFVFDPDRNIDAFRQCYELSLQARDREPDLALVVWPESMFTANVPELRVDPGAEPSEAIKRVQEQFRENTRITAEHLNAGRPPDSPGLFVLVGTETVQFRPAGTQQFNAALLLDRRGDVAERYYKMHPVMFGEYVPGGDWFPWLYRVTPLPHGLTPGPGPTTFAVRGVRLSPSICFESTVPHLIRRHVAELRRQGRPPDALVNITHDGWFWGSSIVELHLYTGVFRAVENRRPFLVAANSGLSAHIDAAGRFAALGRRREQDVVVARVRPTEARSVYEVVGDGPAATCGLLTLAMLVVGWRSRARRTDGGND